MYRITTIKERRWSQSSFKTPYEVIMRHNSGKIVNFELVNNVC